MKGGFSEPFSPFMAWWEMSRKLERRLEKEAAECDQNYAGKLKALFSLFKQVETFCSGHAFFA